MSLFSFVVGVLATWRISSLLVQEDGPWHMFAKFRNFIGVRYDELSQPYGENVFAELFTCVWCMSIWVGIFVAVLLYTTPIYILIPFALSAGTIWINEETKRK